MHITIYNISFTVPSEPCSLKVVSITTSSVTLQWMPPETTNGVIMRYSIQYGDTVINTFGNNTLMGTIEGLSPDTEYKLKLKAHTSVGAGPPCSLTVKTCKLIIQNCLSHITALSINYFVHVHTYVYAYN